MAGRQGELDLLTIGAIFVVVFGLFYGGIQFSKGELLPADTTTDTEDRLRTAVWAELDERRVARGLEKMPRDRFSRGIAQDTTDQLAHEWPTSAANGSVVTADESLPNGRLFCTQIPVRVPVSNVSREPTEETAVAVADALDASPARSVLYRPPAQFDAGMGIAIHDGAVFAVYRSCERVDT